MNENFILHEVQCVSDYFAPHVANRCNKSYLLKALINMYLGMNLPPEGRGASSHGIDSRLLRKLFSDIFTMYIYGVHSNLRNGV